MVIPGARTLGRKLGIGSVADEDAVKLTWERAHHLQPLHVHLMRHRRKIAAQVRIR